jgi:hypothetical protein
VFKPGYKDRFTYSTQMFAVAIAALGLTGVILAGFQTAYAIIAYYHDGEVTISQQMLDVLQAINASLGELTLKIDQLNLTHS